MSLDTLLSKNIKQIEVPGRNIIVLDCGTMEYREALALQETLHQQRIEKKIPDTLILVEHPHVYTAGRNSSSEEVAEVAASLEEPVHHVGRGGMFTYHGPGQLVGYPIIRVRHDSYAQVITATGKLCAKIANAYRISAYAKAPESFELGTGVWCGEPENPKKLASIGFQMDRSFRDPSTTKRTVVSMHGFALNVNTDLTYFHKITPCGYDAKVMTSLAQIWQKKVPMDGVKAATIRALEESWDYKWE